ALPIFTASGRAILAALPAAQLRVLYGHAADFTARTEVPGPSRPKELRELLAAVRPEGVARESGEGTAELASVAAVVRDHAGWPTASEALTLVEQATDEPRRPLCATAGRRAAVGVTRRIGGGPAGPARAWRAGSSDPEPSARGSWLRTCRSFVALRGPAAARAGCPGCRAASPGTPSTGPDADGVLAGDSARPDPRSQR